MVRWVLPGEGFHDAGSDSSPENRAYWHNSDQDTPECILRNTEVEDLIESSSYFLVETVLEC